MEKNTGTPKKAVFLFYYHKTEHAFEITKKMLLGENSTTFLLKKFQNILQLLRG